MTIYLIKPVDLEYMAWKPWWDKQFGCLIRANDEIEARQIAASDAGDEGKAVWLDPVRTSCVDVSSLLEGGPAVLLRDFASA